MTLPALELQEAFTTALTATAPAWETIASSYVPAAGGLRSFSSNQGKSSDLDRDAAGTAQFVVDVRDRELDPANAASSHYPYVTPNRPIRLVFGYVAEVLRDNPRSYWRLGDPNTTDAYTRDEQRSTMVTAVNSPTWQQPGILTGHDAVTFTAASSQYVDCGDLSLFETGDVSYEAWVKTSSATINQVVFSEANSGTAVGYSQLIAATAGGVARINAVNNAGTSYTADGTTVVNDGAWHHVVLTIHANLMRLFVDGVQESNVATAGTFTQNRAAIGALAWSGFGAYFTGTIGEVAVYAYALSAARILAHYNAGATNIGGYVHSGYVDAHNIAYSGPHDATVTIPATDRLKLLARAKLTVVSGEERASQRIVDVLAAVGYYFRTYVYLGSAIMGPHALESQYALDTIMEAVDTETGRLFVDKNGVLVFISRRAVNEQNNYTTSQATFSDSGAAGAIPYTTIVFENSDTLLRNSVEIDHPTLDPVTVTDATSITRNGTMTFARTVHDAAATAQNATAEAILARYKDPQTRVLSVTVPTSRTTATYPRGMYGKVLSLALGMRVTVERTPPGGGAPISQECFILSQSQQCDATRQTWWTTFGFTLAQDVSSYGAWDTATWDNDDWGF